MKKILALALLIATLLALASCGTDNIPTVVTVPDGMRVGETGDGYTFFVPEDWTVERSTGITMAYVSPTDSSNVTFVRTATDKTPAEYYAESEAKLSEMLEDYLLVDAGDNATFGGKSAIYRNYTCKLAGVEYKVLQYLASYEGMMYLFTYTAKTEIPSGDVSYYDRYLETVFDIASAFTFSGKKAETGTAEAPAPTTNANGMILASDPAVARYSLWVPAHWTVDLQNGTTSAYTDTAAVTVSYEIPAETTIDEYWQARSATYSQLYTNYTVIDAECSPPAKTIEEVEVWLDEHQAVRYVYTYTYGGIAYKAQKLMTIEGMYIYTITFTARAEAYDSLTTDIIAIRDAFTFD